MSKFHWRDNNIVFNSQLTIQIRITFFFLWNIILWLSFYCMFNEINKEFFQRHKKNHKNSNMPSSATICISHVNGDALRDDARKII